MFCTRVAWACLACLLLCKEEGSSPVSLQFCLVDYNCMIILLSVTVFVCHDKGNVFFVQ